MPESFRVLDAARSIVDEVNALIDGSTPRLLCDAQLRSSAGSIAANIREALGRRAGPERNQFFRFARGSAEETDEHLRANQAGNRITIRTFWRLHHRIVAVIKMLNVMLGKRERKRPVYSSERRS